MSPNLNNFSQSKKISGYKNCITKKTQKNILKDLKLKKSKNFKKVHAINKLKITERVIFPEEYQLKIKKNLCLKNNAHKLTTIFLVEDQFKP